MTLGALHPAWTVSRAAGIAALVLASASVCFGLLLAARRAGRLADLRGVHETLGIATLVALAIHGLALLADPWLHPAPSSLVVPFALDYRPFWTGLGVIAAYSLFALSVGHLARRRIGAARWKRVHRLTIVFWGLGIVHTLGAGTDAGTAWLLAIVLMPVAVVALLALLRLRPPSRRPSRAPGRAV